MRLPAVRSNVVGRWTVRGAGASKPRNANAPVPVLLGIKMLHAALAAVRARSARPTGLRRCRTPRYRGPCAPLRTPRPGPSLRSGQGRAAGPVVRGRSRPRSLRHSARSLPAVSRARPLPARLAIIASAPLRAFAPARTPRSLHNRYAALRVPLPPFSCPLRCGVRAASFRPIPRFAFAPCGQAHGHGRFGSFGLAPLGLVGTARPGPFHSRVALGAPHIFAGGVRPPCPPQKNPNTTFTPGALCAGAWSPPKPHPTTPPFPHFPAIP